MTVNANQLALFAQKSEGFGSFSEFCRKLGVVEDPNWVDRFGQALRRWAEQISPIQVNTLSLFTGAGGLDIAFHDAGFCIQTMVEIDERFVATLKTNTGSHGYFGDVQPVSCDIREFHPKKNIKVDFIIGGPPCQSFSAAGRRAAGVQGTTDHRGSLFEEYVRLLKQLKPRGFLFENVYGITGAEKGRSWKKICEAFKGAGYRIFYRVLDTADYGVPQHRERLFIVGTKGEDFRFPYPTHGPDSPDGRPYHTASEAIAGAEVTREEAAATVRGRFGHLLKEIPAGLNYSYFTEQMGHPNPVFAWRSKFSDFLYKAAPDSPIRTLKAQGGQYTGPFHWNNRPFSIGELKRLQTFPDAYTVSGRRQVAIHQIGNSVPPQIGRVLAVAILNQLFGVKIPHPLPLLVHTAVLGFRRRKRALTTVYRAKANAAINGLLEGTIPTSPSKVLKPARNYKARLGDDFAWVKGARGSNSIHVFVSVNRSRWAIQIVSDKGPPKPSFTVEVHPATATEWSLGAPKVMLQGNMLDKDLFTGSWKAFEVELARRHLKADLVQLCGYYQYKPAFYCKMEFHDPTVPWEWNSLRKVVEGKGVGKILDKDDVAALCKTPKTRVLDFAIWLKCLGYEVRNNRTNPQIPVGAFLIPYAFPTLTPLSVQLRKSLVGQDNAQGE